MPVISLNCVLLMYLIYCGDKNVLGILRAIKIGFLAADISFKFDTMMGDEEIWYCWHETSKSIPTESSTNFPENFI